jgi:hypothetical protein
MSAMAFAKGLRCLLREVVTDAAGDRPMLVLAGELTAIRGGRSVRRAVRVALHRDRRNGDRRGAGEPLLRKPSSALDREPLNVVAAAGPQPLLIAVVDQL